MPITIEESIISPDFYNYLPKMSANLQDYVDSLSDLHTPSDIGSHSNFAFMQLLDSNYDQLAEADTASDTNIHDYTDSISNIDASADKGSHDVFADVQSYPDSVYDAMLEADQGSSGTNINDYADSDTSNVDSHADHGTHSSFANEQSAPDSTYDTLTEANSGSLNSYNYVVSSAPDDYPETALGTHSDFTNMQDGINGEYDTLTEENTGTPLVDYVNYIDEISDIYTPSDIGTHSSFAEQQDKDGAYDTLTESASTGGTAFDVDYVESLGESSSSSVSWTEKCGIDINPASGTRNYVILAMADYCASIASYLGYVRIQLGDATTVCQAQYYQKDPSDYVSFFWCSYRTVTSGTPLLVDMDYAVSNVAELMYIRDARIIAFECTAEGYDEDSARTTTTSTTWGTKSTLTITPTGTETYIIISSMVLDGSSASYSTGSRVYNGASALVSNLEEPTVATNHKSCFGMIQRVSIGAATTYTNQFNTESGGTAGCAYSNLIVIDTDSFNNVYYNSDTGSTSPAGSGSWYDKVSNVYTPLATNHLIIGSLQYGSDSTSNSISTQLLTSDAVSQGITECEDKDTSDWHSAVWFEQQTLTASEKTDKLQMNGESTSVDTQQAWIFSLELVSDFTPAQLDLEERWTGVTSTHTYEYLCIYGGTQDSEALKVNVYSSGWVNVIADVTSGWNNVSISSYLIGSSFYIQFVGTDESADSTQSSWQVESVLLHCWTDADPEYEIDLEIKFTGVTQYSESNEYLCVYAGNLDATEYMTMTVYNGATWDLLNFVEVENGWNNYSISTWLTSSSISFMFFDDIAWNPEGKIAIPRSSGLDEEQTSWQIDYAIIHTWTDTTNYELDLEVQWTTADYDETNEYVCVYTGTQDAEALKLQLWNGAWNDLTTDLVAGQWNNYSVSAYLTTATLTLRYVATTESGDSTQSSWQIDSCLLWCYTDAVIDYELDLEEQWTTADYDETNEELCIYAGAFSGEVLKVDIWTGTWTNIIASLTASQWNNVSVSSYLTASTFTIRFLGGTESGDSTQTTFNIDSVVLHCWSTPILYELDLEVGWTGATYDQQNEYLCVYGGTQDAESLKVDVWGGSWITLISDIQEGWNNVSVATYLTTSALEIRFVDTSKVTDTNQDEWNIDVVLLHVWNNLPSSFTLTDPPDDSDGTFQLQWTISTDADNYSVYQHTSLITVINGSVSLLQSGVTDLYYDIIDHTNGTFYFIVVAINEEGSTLSNCISVVIQDPPWDFILTSTAGSPDLDGDYDLEWTPSTGADLYGVWRHTSLITVINASLTWLGTDTSPFNVLDQTNGTWYYIIEAQNEAGNTTSNCISVTVQDDPWNFILSENADDPDLDGDFDLLWTSSSYADNYSVYRHTSFITDINASVLYLGFTTNLYWNVTDLGSGTWYFIIEAQNEHGNTSSNCISIIISISLPPESFTLTEMGDNPDPDGDFYLNWTASSYADNYTVYRHTSFITTINGSVTLVQSGIVVLYYYVNDYTNGTWYFVVLAVNEIGNYTSNCVSVTVQDPPWNFSVDQPTTPDLDGDFQLTWDESYGADNYGIWEYNSYITELNSSLTFVGLTANEYWNFDHHANGTWYFRIEAVNEAGNTTSLNCVNIVIQDAPWDFILSSNAGSPEQDGNFDLLWTESVYADLYGIWRHTSLITEINGTLTWIGSITELYWNITDLTAGIWYFIIESQNEYDNTTSNCISITVQDIPSSFVLSENADNPDADGTFDLLWTASERSDNYTAYRHTSFITEINGSLYVLQSGITNLYYNITSLSNGTWYFIVVAYNEMGNTLSNCISVIVQDPPWEFILLQTTSPDLDGDFYLNWTISTGTDLYGIWQYTSFITDINGSLTWLGSTTNLYLFINNHLNGTYYFIIEAQNEAGNETSNCIQIVIQDPPLSFTLTSTATNPDPDGEFQLQWTLSYGADNYTVYRHTSFITEINGSVTFLNTIVLLYYDFFAHQNGTFYFIIESQNEYGNKTSNCIQIVIQDSPWDFTLSENADNPDLDGDFDLYWTSSYGNDLYGVWVHTSYITQINASVDFVGSTTNLYWNFTHYTNGTWYFIIEASNEAGNTTSNCISIIIQDAPWTFILSSTGSPDTDGNFDLLWTSSSYSDGYGVWQYNSFITEINASLTFLGYTTNLYWNLTSYVDDTYYFIIEAQNEYDNTTSNCISVMVLHLPESFILSSNAELPEDHDWDFDLIWTDSNYATLYKVYRHSSFITVINGSITYIGETANLYWNFTSHTNGTWYFIISASNDAGNVSSNCISVDIQDLPWVNILSSNAESPQDHDGNFDLLWTNSVGTDNYSVYVYTSYITVINGSVTFIANVFTLYYNFTSYQNGSWYFIIQNTNEVGSVLSNCINIIIQDNPWEFTLYSTSEEPDLDGNFDLYWSLSYGADNYSIYRHTSIIIEINGSITYLGNTVNLYWNLTSYSNATYYFITIAFNEAGNESSNCISVTVQGLPWNFTLSSTAGTPDIDGYFDLNWSVSIESDNYSVYRHTSIIIEINGSITYLGNTINIYWNLTAYDNGTYYFIIVAFNEVGNTSSNCIEIIVELSITPPMPFTLTTTADNPDKDGLYTLVWTVSVFANNYYVYISVHYITVVNETVELLGITTDLFYHIIKTEQGSFYYMVIAHNLMGNTASNNVLVNISFSDEGGGGGGVDHTTTLPYGLQLAENIFMESLFFIASSVFGFVVFKRKHTKHRRVLH